MKNGCFKNGLAFRRHINFRLSPKTLNNRLYIDLSICGLEITSFQLIWTCFHRSKLSCWGPQPRPSALVKGGGCKKQRDGDLVPVPIHSTVAHPYDLVLPHYSCVPHRTRIAETEAVCDSRAQSDSHCTLCDAIRGLGHVSSAGIARSLGT